MSHFIAFSFKILGYLGDYNCKGSSQKKNIFLLLDINKKRGLKFQAKWLDQYP